MGYLLEHHTGFPVAVFPKPCLTNWGIQVAWREKQILDNSTVHTSSERFLQNQFVLLYLYSESTIYFVNLGSLNKTGTIIIIFIWGLVCKLLENGSFCHQKQIKYAKMKSIP